MSAKVINTRSFRTTAACGWYYDVQKDDGTIIKNIRQSFANGSIFSKEKIHSNDEDVIKAIKEYHDAL